MPDDFESNFNEGLQLFQKKQYEEAIRKFKDSVFLNPESAEAHYFLARSIIASETDDDNMESLNEKENEAIKEFKIAIKINPKDPEAYFYLGRSLCDTPSLQEGLDLLKKAINFEPHNEKYKQYIELVFLINNLSDDGISFFRDLIRNDPKNAHNHEYLAMLFEDKGLFEEAVIEDKETIILDPYKSENYLKVSKKLKKLCRIDEARLLLDGAVQSFPDDESLKKEYQSIFIDKIVDFCEKKLWNDAISTFQALIANEEKKYGYKDVFGNHCGSSPITELLWKAFEGGKNPIDGINLFLRLYPLDSGNYSLSSNLEKSLKKLKINDDVIDDYLVSIRQHEDCADIHLNLIEEIPAVVGTEYIIIEEYRKAIILNPTLGFPHCEIGIMYYIRGKNEEAIQEFYEGIKKDPDNPNFGDYYYYLALVLIKENRIDEAISNFHKATELEPLDYDVVYHDMISHLLNKELLDKAEEVFNKSIEIFKTLLNSGKKIQDLNHPYCRAHCALGEVYEKRGKFDDAIFYYRQAVKIKEDNSEPHRLLADVLLKKNQISDAIAEYRKVIELDAKCAPDHKKLADALMKNGQFLDALPEYREAMRLDPDNAEYSDAWMNLKTTLIDREAFEKAMQSRPGQQGSLLKGHYQSIEDEFQQLIANGENEVVEFKTSALWSKNFLKEDIENSNEGDIKKFGKDVSKIAIAKTIAGFLNTDGGNLVIGIKENKDGNNNDITGIEGEFSKLKDHCTDGYRRMITDEIIRKFFSDKIFHHLSNYIKIEFPKCNRKIVCWLKIKKSDIPVYLNIQNDDYFFIRTDATTIRLGAGKATDYCHTHFWDK